MGSDSVSFVLLEHCTGVPCPRAVLALFWEAYRSKGVLDLGRIIYHLVDTPICV